MSPLRPFVLLFVVEAVLGLGTAAASADDQPFVSLYTTDIDTQGEREGEQRLEWRAGHGSGTFAEFISRTEVEYGITDDFQASAYLNYDWSRAHIVPAPAETQSLLGVSGELIYRFWNVYFDPIGLAVYLEPSYGPGSRSVEAKILLQKNFLNDTLRLALNANFEDDWNRTAGHWHKTSALEFDAGLSYNITPEFSAGLEFDNERQMNGLVLGGDASEQTSAYFLGPTLQYIAGVTKITLGVETQLPIAGNASRVANALHDGFVSDAERYRILLRLSRDF